MEFLNIFEHIDTDFSGSISVEELESYMIKNDYEPNFVGKWMMLFDTNNDGIITIEEFCDTLGLEPSEGYINNVKLTRQRTLKSAPKPKYDDDDVGDLKVLKIAPDMDDELRRFIVHTARTAQDKYELEKDVARHLKLELDKYYHRVWQVIVGRYQFGSFVSHEPGSFFHFWVGRHAFVCWKTPDYDSLVN